MHIHNVNIKHIHMYCTGQTNLLRHTPAQSRDRSEPDPHHWGSFCSLSKSPSSRALKCLVCAPSGSGGAFLVAQWTLWWCSGPWTQHGSSSLGTSEAWATPAGGGWGCNTNGGGVVFNHTHLTSWSLGDSSSMFRIVYSRYLQMTEHIWLT